MAQAIMEQAVVASAVDAAPAGIGKDSADDLLSKLAGDEVDKLLADVEQPSPAAAPARAPESTSHQSATPPPASAAQKLNETELEDSVPANVVAVDAAAPVGTAINSEGSSLPTSGSDNASPDDVLSKMAGSEIDKLLAEAEEPLPAPVPPADSPTISTAPASVVAPTAVAKSTEADGASEKKQVAATELDDLIAGVQAETVAAPVPAPVPAPEPPMSEEEEGVPRPEFKKEEQPRPAPAPASEEAAEEARIKKLSDELELNESGGSATATTDAEIAQITGAAKHAAKAEPVGKPSFLVKILMLINRPVEECSEFAIGFLGKAAVLTFLNAAGVMIYVMVVKKHR